MQKKKNGGNYFFCEHLFPFKMIEHDKLFQEIEFNPYTSPLTSINFSPNDSPSSKPESGLHVFHDMNRVGTPSTPQDATEANLAWQRLYFTLGFACTGQT